MSCCNSIPYMILLKYVAMERLVYLVAEHLAAVVQFTIHIDIYVVIEYYSCEAIVHCAAIILLTILTLTYVVVECQKLKAML